MTHPQKPASHKDASSTPDAEQTGMPAAPTVTTLTPEAVSKIAANTEPSQNLERLSRASQSHARWSPERWITTAADYGALEKRMLQEHADSVLPEALPNNNLTSETFFALTAATDASAGDAQGPETPGLVELLVRSLLRTAKELRDAVPKGEFEDFHEVFDPIVQNISEIENGLLGDARRRDSSQLAKL